MQMFMRDVLAGFVPASTAAKTSGYLSFAASILGVLGVGFGLWGAHIWFTMNLPADYAMLATAGLMLGLAIVSGLIAMCISMVRQSRLRAARLNLQNTVMDMFKSLENGVGQNIQDHPAVSLVVSGLAGFVLAEMTSSNAA